MKQKAPAFQFYPKDFLSDLLVAGMTLSERGAYITLLCHCWLEGTIPCNMAALARICAITDERMADVWKQVGRCFSPSGKRGRLVQKRMEEERQVQTQRRLARQSAGRSGALRRWGINKLDSTAIGLPMAKHASSSSSSSAESQKTHPPTPLPETLTSAYIEWFISEEGFPGNVGHDVIRAMANDINTAEKLQQFTDNLKLWKAHWREVGWTMGAKRWVEEGYCWQSPKVPAEEKRSRTAKLMEDV